MTTKRAGHPALKPLPRYVYGVVDDCPAEWGDKAVLGLFYAKRDAWDFALKTKGTEPGE